MRFDAAQKFKILEDANGFITAEGVIATAGEKLYYKDAVETISENALFESMDSWEGLPLTLTHPKDLLNPTTAQKHQVGSVVKAWRKDNQLWAKFKVTTKTALDAIRQGMRGLSAGYNAFVDENNIQQGRENNHLAIVGVGRSPSSGIRADARRDSFDINHGVKDMPVIKFPNGKEVRIDCSEAEQQLVQTNVDSLTAKLDTAETSVSTVNKFLAKHFDVNEEDASKKLDELGSKIEQMKKDGEDTEKLQAQYDEMKKGMEESKGKMDSDELSSIFDTHEKALQLSAGIKIRKDTGEIKTAREIACEAMPSVKMDGKEDTYVMARLDAAIEYSKDGFIRQQRHDGQDFSNHQKPKMTAQQRADAKFFGTLKEESK